MRVLPGKRRCRIHGGMSTGPRTRLVAPGSQKHSDGVGGHFGQANIVALPRYSRVLATVSRIIRMGVTGATILKGLRNAGQSLGVLTFAFTDVRVGASS